MQIWRMSAVNRERRSGRAGTVFRRALTFHWRCFIRACCAATVSLAYATAGPQPQREPQLQREPGWPLLCLDSETPSADRLTTDREGRLALILSRNNKTVRLHEVASGRLLRVLRTPIDEGMEGALNTGVLSADGALAAVGGFTGKKGMEKYVYLLETATGRMLNRLRADSGGITHVAFSPDERLLAVVQAEGDGLLLFDIKSGERLAADKDYQGTSSAVCFASDGRRLITAASDGWL